MAEISLFVLSIFVAQEKRKIGNVTDHTLNKSMSYVVCEFSENYPNEDKLIVIINMIIAIPEVASSNSDDDVHIDFSILFLIACGTCIQLKQVCVIYSVF